MKIAVCSTFEEKVPPPKYGGVELVVYNLVEELVKMGHDVTLFASGDSKTSAKLVPIFETAVRHEGMSVQEMKIKRDLFANIGVGKILEKLKEGKYDILHNNLGWRLLPYEKFIDSPMVTTVHGPFETPFHIEMFKTFKNSRFISISNNQREPIPELNYVGTVYNGIDVQLFDYREKAGDYFAFLGRISKQKGPVEAINIAKEAGVKLIMAAKVDPVDQKFYDEEVAPLIDGEQIKFIGEVGHKEKNKLLGNAKALLAPIQWREPFGLFFVEAMACGTPVIATKMGSAPEVVKDKETGFVVENSQEYFLEAVRNIDRIDRKKCRQRVEENFSKEKMAENYLKVYESVLKG
ncbi:MAG: glycosyltransferase family 4 protein [Candidatus Portnoybacteria bacterium]|nr:glycosyltransferase family 4 protein [Candidatus Portnoybacteria bacterium]